MIRRMSIRLDTDLIADAAQSLGTSGTTATVGEALRRVVRQAKLEELAAWELPADAAELLAEQRKPRLASL
jgi:Arc/MetJ family transcription regulator